jgi:UDP-glucose 4-epimerase
MRAIFKTYKPIGTVIHNSAVNLKPADFESQVRISVNNAKNIKQIMKEFDCKDLILCSSSKVYGD